VAPLCNISSPFWAIGPPRKVKKVKVIHMIQRPLVKKPHCPGMAHVVEGFHSFTCTPTRLSMYRINHAAFAFTCWFSFTDSRGTEGWVGLSTTTASKQSAQNRYVTAITVVSCSSLHTSMGNWSIMTVNKGDGRTDWRTDGQIYGHTKFK